MAGATHLQNRLDKQDVQHILALKAQGHSATEIAGRYNLSSASIGRILSGAWNRKQIAAWGEPENQTRVRSSMKGAHFTGDEPCQCPLCRAERKPVAVPVSVPLKGRDLSALTHGIADLISACDLVREAKLAAVKAGISEGVLQAIMQEHLMSDGRSFS